MGGTTDGRGMETDILGGQFLRRTIDLGTDDEGPVVATLVSRKADAPTGRAVLYVHGYVDYFFQEHLAEFYANRGIDFYALDLRKYGRSLLPHQTPNFVRSISEYFPELDEAARIIREEDGHRRLLVNAHSTGGLITALWAHRVRDADIVDGLFMNSPFFEINVPAMQRPGWPRSAQRRPGCTRACPSRHRSWWRVRRAASAAPRGRRRPCTPTRCWTWSISPTTPAVWGGT